MNYKQLTPEERYQIHAYLKAGFKQKEIAGELNRSPSSISREIKRNTGQRGYRPLQANMFALNRRKAAYKSIKLTTQVRAWIDALLGKGFPLNRSLVALIWSIRSQYIMRLFISISTEIKLLEVAYSKTSREPVRNTESAMAAMINGGNW